MGCTASAATVPVPSGTLVHSTYSGLTSIPGSASSYQDAVLYQHSPMPSGLQNNNNNAKPPPIVFVENQQQQQQQPSKPSPKLPVSSVSPLPSQPQQRTTPPPADGRRPSSPSPNTTASKHLFVAVVTYDVPEDKSKHTPLRVPRVGPHSESNSPPSEKNTTNPSLQKSTNVPPLERNTSLPPLDRNTTTNTNTNKPLTHAPVSLPAPSSSSTSSSSSSAITNNNKTTNASFSLSPSAPSATLAPSSSSPFGRKTRLSSGQHEEDELEARFRRKQAAEKARSSAFSPEGKRKSLPVNVNAAPAQTGKVDIDLIQRLEKNSPDDYRRNVRQTLRSLSKSNSLSNLNEVLEQPIVPASVVTADSDTKLAIDVHASVLPAGMTPSTPSSTALTSLPLHRRKSHSQNSHNEDNSHTIFGLHPHGTAAATPTAAAQSQPVLADAAAATASATAAAAATNSVPARTRPRGHRRPVALIVDDVKVTQVITSAALVNAGFASEVASSGPEAVAKCKSTVYELILMDVGLGQGMTGVEATKEIRKFEAQHGFQPVNIFGLTAAVTKSDLHSYQAAGMNACLEKGSVLKSSVKDAVELVQRHAHYFFINSRNQVFTNLDEIDDDAALPAKTVPETTIEDE